MPGSRVRLAVKVESQRKGRRARPGACLLLLNKRVNPGTGWSSFEWGRNKTKIKQKTCLLYLHVLPKATGEHEQH